MIISLLLFSGLDAWGYEQTPYSVAFEPQNLKIWGCLGFKGLGPNPKNPKEPQKKRIWGSNPLIYSIF